MIIPFTTLPDLVARGAKLTPMMEQYYQLKQVHPEALLLFRMGDFYEVFFEDAQVLSKILNLTLTSRGTLLDVPIPMAGIPHHVLTTYAERLVQAGLRVAICDQLEDPKNKETKGIVKRGITQLASPGLPLMQATLDQHLELQKDQRPCFIAACDPSTFQMVLIDGLHGQLLALSAENQQEFLEFFELYAPKELLTYPGQWEGWQLPAIPVTPLSSDFFELDKKEGLELLKNLLPPLANDLELQQNGALLKILCALVKYLQASWQTSRLYQFSTLTHMRRSAYLFVNSDTLQGLELIKTGEQNIFALWNQTQTASGTRLLWEWFHRPLALQAPLDERLDWIDRFLPHWAVVVECRRQLQQIRDIRRILTRASAKKITAQDLILLKNNARIFLSLKTLLADKNIQMPTLRLGPATILGPNQQDDHYFDEFASLIEKALSEELGASLEKGTLIKNGFNQQRDQLAQSQGGSQEKVDRLEERYRTDYQLPTLRIKSNNIAGHFIEISKQAAKAAPKEFTRIQTLTNVERFLSPELKEIEQEFEKSLEQLRLLEEEIFDQLVERVVQQDRLWNLLSDQLALLDVLLSLTFLAHREKLTRPQWNTQWNKQRNSEQEQKARIELNEMWHPLVQKQMGITPMVKHCLHLDHQAPFALLTGPNMAGKTTVMKEIALCQFLGQMGSFVPASSAKLMVLDALFTRLGANDDINRGQSTFMVEMSQTAHILRRATPRSLIILDELGRGTSTYDGLGLAWAISEELVKLGAFTLFSTHYHELVDAVEQMPGARNLTMKVAVEGDQIQFHYTLVEGGAKQSFGHHVALLAGIAPPLVQRARGITEKLERRMGSSSNTTGESAVKKKKAGLGMEHQQLTLFDAANKELL